MSVISSSFVSSFGVSGQLGVGTSSILGANATGTPTAASVLAANTTTTGPFAAINASHNTIQSPTIAALTTGKLTEQQEKVLSSIGSSTTPVNVPWAGNGSEPTIITQLRGYGWIKLVKPEYDPKTHAVTSADYTLTPVGEAINRRTGGGVGATQSSAANSVDVTA